MAIGSPSSQSDPGAVQRMQIVGMPDRVTVTETTRDDKGQIAHIEQTESDL